MSTESLRSTPIGAGRASRFHPQAWEHISQAVVVAITSMDPHHLEAYDVRQVDQPVGGRRGWTRIDTGQRYPKPAGLPGPKFGIGWMRAHMACLAHFLTSVATGTPGDPGLEQGVYVQRLIECARVSAETRNWVNV